MNQAELNVLHIIHVASAVGLVGAVFYACAGAPETKRRVAIWGGIATVLLLLTGIRMWQGLYGFQGVWVIVKLVCWVGLSALSGLAYRRRQNAGGIIKIALVLALVALAMVYTKPFA